VELLVFGARVVLGSGSGVAAGGVAAAGAVAAGACSLGAVSARAKKEKLIIVANVRRPRPCTLHP
jgi:hypothetical protein